MKWLNVFFSSLLILTLTVPSAAGILCGEFHSQSQTSNCHDDTSTQQEAPRSSECPVCDIGFCSQSFLQSKSAYFFSTSTYKEKNVFLKPHLTKKILSTQWLKENKEPFFTTLFTTVTKNWHARLSVFII